jgi:PAS domain S-box-containing protein
MKTAEQYGSRTGWVFLLIFVLLATGIVIAGWFYYRNVARRFRAEVECQLSAIADLKVGELVQYRKERLADGSTLFQNAAISALVRRFLEKPEDADAQREIQGWLGKYQSHFQYDELRLLDTQGVSRLSLPANPPAVSSAVGKGISNALQSGQVTLQDFYRCEQCAQVHLGVLVPILDEQAGNRPLGVFLLRIAPATYLYPFIQRWPTVSKTAETLLVRREGNDVVFLNELRFQTNTALNLRVPLERVALPAAQAALGREGIMEGVDYRGMPVVAALRTVLDSPWALVARMDAAEVYAPLRAQLWQVVVMIGFLLFGAGAGVGLLWRQQRVRHFREQAEAAEALRESENNYALLFHEMQNGFAVHEIICDEAGNPSDYRFLAVNPAFERMTGLKAAETVGRTVSEILPDTERNWIEHYGKVALTGVPVRFENYAASLKKHFEVVAFRPKIEQFACVFTDITERKQAEEQLRQQGEKLQASNEELSRLNRLMTGRELRVIEIKQQVNDLTAQLGQPRPYPLAFMDAAAAEVLRTTPKPGEQGGVISDQ